MCALYKGGSLLSSEFYLFLIRPCMLKATPRRVAWQAGIESGFFEKKFCILWILLLTIGHMFDIMGFKLYKHDFTRL